VNMILSENYRELSDDISDEELDDAIDEAVVAARLIADDPHILLDDFLKHLKKIYPVWIRDAGSWNELLSICLIDASVVMKIHQECCNIYDSLHTNDVPNHWEISADVA